jgi:hypothetical protein
MIRLQPVARRAIGAILLAAGASLLRAQSAGPAPGARLTEAYLRHVARDVTFWAWPMVDVYGARLTGRLRMLPEADFVRYGGPLALDREPVVVQVPDFGDRFWSCLAADLRTDAFANLGAVYGAKPGFYLLVGPKWNGETPRGIARVFHARTSTGFLVARVFTDGTPADRQAAETLLLHFDAYPLSQFDGSPKLRNGEGRASGEAPEAPAFVPATFFERLPAVLQDAPPLPGEDTRYGEAKALLAAMKKDATIKAAAIEEAGRAEKDLIAPLFEFENFGLPLANRWTAVEDGADFGTDYDSRTALRRADLFVPRANEEKSYYLDRDRDGGRLDGAHRYTVTFARGALPPVRGSWSLTLYDARHAFTANPMDRHAVGTANRDLTPSADGGLVIIVQADEPGTASQRANWLPAPKEGGFSLVLRAWWPESGITSGRWTPPPVVRVK